MSVVRLLDWLEQLEKRLHVNTFAREVNQDCQGGRGAKKALQR
jgi:hypothetical protein